MNVEPSKTTDGDKASKKRKAERELASNELFWRNELLKHAAASFVTFVVICGYFAPFPEDIVDKVTGVPVVRLWIRCLAMAAFSFVFIPWGVHHGIRTRCTKFFDDVYEYDTVPAKTKVKVVFLVLGPAAHLILTMRAAFDFAAHPESNEILQILFWLLIPIGLVVIFVGAFWWPKMEYEEENKNDKPPGE